MPLRPPLRALVVAAAALAAALGPAPARADGPAGIGVSLQPTEDGLLRVAQTRPGGPAAAAGLRADDVLVRIAGRDVAGRDPGEAAADLRGEAGTLVRVTVRRRTAAGGTEDLEVEIRRAPLDAGAPASAARTPPVEPTDPSPLEALLPEVRTAPAPAWVRPGVRITWYSAAASIRGAATEMVEDEDGAWIDRATGRRYTEAEVAGGGSGHGYTQVDVASVDARAVALDLRSWGIEPSSGRLLLLGSGGSVAPPGAGGDFWVHPDVLRKALALDGRGGTRVLRTPYRIGERDHRAIRIHTPTANGFTTYVYDEESGVLLHSGASAKGAAQTVRREDRDAGEGATLLTRTTLVGVRERSVPWAAAPAPEWLGTTRAMVYEGSTVPRVAGATSFAIPTTLRLELLRRGPSWVRFRQVHEVAGLGGMPSQRAAVDRACGTAQFGGVFLPPEARASLRAGLELDRDPTTQVVTSVAGFSRGPRREELVTIVEANASVRCELTYDVASGALVGYRQQDPLTTTELSLVRRE